MVGALRSRLEEMASEEGASTKERQLVENWMGAEDRADRIREQLSSICLQEVPRLKREKALAEEEKQGYLAQISLLQDDVQEATALGHILARSPQPEDMQRVHLEKEAAEKQAAETVVQKEQAEASRQRAEEEKAKAEAEKTKAEEEAADIRARMTKMCTEQIPELTQENAALKQQVIELGGERDQLRGKMTTFFEEHYPQMEMKVQKHEQHEDEIEEQRLAHEQAIAEERRQSAEQLEDERRDRREKEAAAAQELEEERVGRRESEAASKSREAELLAQVERMRAEKKSREEQEERRRQEEQEEQRRLAELREWHFHTVQLPSPPLILASRLLASDATNMGPVHALQPVRDSMRLSLLYGHFRF